MNAPVLPLYVLDDENAGEDRLGAASRWWLHHSLTRLDESLGGALICLRDAADELLPRLARNVGASAVFWNRCYEPWRIERDKRIKSVLAKAGIKVRSFNGSLLYEPPQVTKKKGTPYRVFTPYFRKGCLKRSPPPRRPEIRQPVIDLYRERGGETIEDLDLLPSVAWYGGLDAEWTPGEAGARTRLETFLATGLRGYGEGRNRPDKNFVSRLSPHLHFGEISPHTVWYAVLERDGPRDAEADIDAFIAELGWREFAHYLLYFSPELPRANLQRKFDRFPWREGGDELYRWQRGQTGIPIVDAGMRELWQTGYMHNRLRMVVGSFLVKNLLVDWRHGAAWFWDTLVDADLANNSAGWQWIAGSGTDAAPYFRIFNPVTQGRRFDPEGAYVRRFVPELAALPDKWIHCPWDAPAAVLGESGVVLGESYPQPIVDLKSSRERALAAFKSLSAT